MNINIENIHIGDWLYYKNEPIKLTIDVICDKFINDNDNFAYIPLTSELLEANGFWVDTSFDECTIKDKNCELILYYNILKECWTYDAGDFIIYIKYISGLQALLRAFDFHTEIKPMEILKK